MKTYLFAAALAVLPITSWAVAEQEPNGIPSFATPFNIGDTLTGNFVNDGENLEDQFGPFSTISGRTYRFVATVQNGNSIDIAIGTVNSSNALVGGTETDVAFNGGSETRNFVAPGTGPYYFYIREATGTPNGINSYSVATSLLPPAGINDWGLY
jgi:hypothetical protein